MTAPCARGIGKKSHEGRVLRVVMNQGMWCENKFIYETEGEEVIGL